MNLKELVIWANFILFLIKKGMILYLKQTKKIKEIVVGLHLGFSDVKFPRAHFLPPVNLP